MVINSDIVWEQAVSRRSSSIEKMYNIKHGRNKLKLVLCLSYITLYNVETLRDSVFKTSKWTDNREMQL